jgi:hypothetical protein
LALLKERIPLDELPKTFQEAVVTARHLGIRYVWIDSLRIIQDSQEDWDYESSRMCDYYSSSFINIAAAASKDGRQGFFFPRGAEHGEDMRAAVLNWRQAVQDTGHVTLG